MTSKTKINQFKWLAATLLLVTAMVMPSVAWADDVVTYTNGFGSDGSYQEATQTTGKYDIDGDGQFDNVYEIGNAGQLYWFAALVNGTNGLTQNLAANAVLTADITVNTGVLDENGNLSSNTSSFTSWTPIGRFGNEYSGIFDGNNHTISGLYYNSTYSDNGVFYYAGLFGCIIGTIKNVGVVDSYFELKNVSGACGIGGVCGENRGTITNIYNKGKVIGINENKDYSINVGGVCGVNTDIGKIENCYNAGNVIGNEDTGSNHIYTGGVCGQNYGIITNCYNEGNVSGSYIVGGICGKNDCTSQDCKYTIVNCYNRGTVSCNFRSSGSLCGNNNAYNRTQNCYYLDTTGIDSYATAKTSTQFASGEVAYLLSQGCTIEDVNYEGSVWKQNIDNGAKDAYPLLDSSHGTVYASAPCPSSFSNTNNLAEVEHNYVANSEHTEHTCTKCGKTHDAEFTVNNETNIISACHGFGSVTLKAPTENLTYDGKAKEAAVEGALTGIATPNILYKLKNSSETATETVPVNAGTYTASITYTISGTDYSVSVEYTIEKADDVPNHPNELYGCIGEKLSTVSLENHEGWSWDNPESTLPENVENIKVKASYSGDDKDNYKNITAVDVTIILIPHIYTTNGFCKYCGGYMPAWIVSNDHYPELRGTHKGYYVIENAGQLYWFAGLVNGTLSGEEQYISANAVLTGNITVNTGDIAGCNGIKGNSWIDWTPIGIRDESTELGYLGTFDGNNKTISGLYFNDSNTNNVGLFGFSNGTIKNVGVVDSYFNGSWNVGGVCGNNVNGRIENCYTTSSVNGTTYIGGVCGRNDTRSIILNSYNLGAVSGTTNVGGVRGDTKGTITNCYYLANEDDKNGGKTEEQFKNGEVAYLLAQGCTVGETFYDGSVWGQQLRVNDYPVLESDYKVLMAARDGLGGSIYWATFSNLNSNAELIDPMGGIAVYNATVSAGTLTLTKRSDNNVPSGEGVLLKANSEYVNAKNISDYLDATTGKNDLVATPKDAGVLNDTNYKHYRLTYNDVDSKEGIGFYLGVVKDETGNVTSNVGSQIRVTPGKAYLKVSTQAATEPSTAKLARGFAFPGDDETTGIECITVTDESLHRNGNAEGIFDLQGRKVSKPTKGVYINNGKKVIIK